MGDDQTGGDVARSATDRLAVALEEVGFDVGLEFPALHDAIGCRGQAVVRIGDVAPMVADRLSDVLLWVNRSTDER